jgi:hypothetical protein
MPISIAAFAPSGAPTETAAPAACRSGGSREPGGFHVRGAHSGAAFAPAGAHTRGGARLRLDRMRACRRSYMQPGARQPFLRRRGLIV